MCVGRTIDGPANPSQKSSRPPRDARTRPPGGASGSLGRDESVSHGAATESSPPKLPSYFGEGSLDDHVAK